MEKITIQNKGSWLKRKINPFFYPHKFGFYEGHSYISDNEVINLKKVISDSDSSNDARIIGSFEKKFVSHMGGGKGTSYAAGRMAFYSLLDYLNIRFKDEIILPAFTCSVMINAILRRGAIPKYYNIDPNTFGSNLYEIEKIITDRTKLVVVQHSFGIPCDIGPIQSFCHEKSIFLLEDSALSFDSTIEGKKVGLWGDAAIFSFDRGKPLNALIGGILFSRDSELIEIISKNNLLTDRLSHKQQTNIFNHFIIERKYLNYNNYWKYYVKNNINSLITFITDEPAFLTDDYSSQIKIGEAAKYPYPAKIPAFCAKIGELELNNWAIEKKRRKIILNQYLAISEEEKEGDNIPSAYYDKTKKIVPLRFVFTHPKVKEMLVKMNSFLDINSILFDKPIVCCKNMREFNYFFGMCPISEKVCNNIINWPCIIGESKLSILLNKYRDTLRYVNQSDNNHTGIRSR